MKINKEQMKTLAAKSDEELWKEILNLAAGHGYDLSGSKPKKEDLEKVRRALTGVEKLSFIEAAKLLNSYKKK